MTSKRSVVLLHGPPGTGKTSLSQALAQKVAIRFSDRFSQVVLVEVNAHSLFSKVRRTCDRQRLVEPIAEIAVLVHVFTHF